MTAKCPDCGQEFASKPAAYLHWKSAHYRYRLGDGERAVLDDLDGAEERRAEERRNREERA